jgi:Domain of unknown function (DUF1707)
MQNTADMKASDADRDAVLSALSEHFQAGRLTSDEFDERAGQALAARTWGQLTDLLQDLPGTRPGPQAPAAASSAARPVRPPARSPMRRAPAPIAMLAVIGIAVAVSAGIAHRHWGFLWLAFAGLFIARRLVYCCAGSPRRSGLRD